MSTLADATPSSATASLPRTASPQRTRFEAVLTGGTPDRVPRTAWQHHIPQESDVATLAATVADEARRYGWDWIKVNPRATYLPEAFGNRYELTDYTGVLPRRTHTLITGPADLAAITPNPDAPSLAEHVRLIELLRAELPDLPLLPTVFSPLAVLLELAGTPSYVTALAPTDPRPREVLAELLEANPSGVHSALAAITETLTSYLAQTAAAGADGVFYAVTGTAHSEVATAEQFAELSTPYDDAVLASVSGWRIVHTCGPQSHPEWVDRAGVHAVHWDQTAEGNPTLAQARLRAVSVGGVSHLALAEGDLATVAAQTSAALALAQPFLLAPACSVPPTVTDDGYRVLATTGSEGTTA